MLRFANPPRYKHIPRHASHTTELWKAPPRVTILLPWLTESPILQVNCHHRSDPHALAGGGMVVLFVLALIFVSRGPIPTSKTPDSGYSGPASSGFDCRHGCSSGHSPRDGTGRRLSRPPPRRHRVGLDLGLFGGVGRYGDHDCALARCAFSSPNLGNNKLVRWSDAITLSIFIVLPPHYKASDSLHAFPQRFLPPQPRVCDRHARSNPLTFFLYGIYL